MSFSPDAFGVYTYRGLDGEVLVISLKEGRAVPCSRSVDVIRRRLASALGVAPRHFVKRPARPGATFLTLKFSAAHLRARPAEIVSKAQGVLENIACKLQAIHRPTHPRHNKEHYRPANRRYLLRAAGAFK
jgi:hypothetical protein